MFVPSIIAIALQKMVCKEPLKKPLGISFKPNRYFLVAWLLPLTIALATLGISLLFPGIEYSPGMEGLIERLRSTLTPAQIEELQRQIVDSPIHPFWVALLQSLIVGPTINAIVGFGEELGWRGFLQKELSKLDFWKSSLIIGIVWGIWHAPIILQGHNYPQHPLAGLIMMVVFTLLLSPIFSYVRIKAKSVIASAIIHGSLNATVVLAIMPIQGGDDLTVGVTGLSGFIVLAIINLLIYNGRV
ncbi:abortive infection protein [Candidatus Bathyarchaeota archaeon RBG_13_38_9]|nr:MAG: abortive infection protein [Candidatus Bathyarchaeota archaeon RBG_13_38_9]